MSHFFIPTTYPSSLKRIQIPVDLPASVQDHGERTPRGIKAMDVALGRGF